MLGGAGGHWAVGLCAANRRESGARTGLHRLARETTLGDAKTPLIGAPPHSSCTGTLVQARLECDLDGGLLPFVVDLLRWQRYVLLAGVGSVFRQGVARVTR